MIPPGSQFVVSLQTINYALQGFNKQALPKDHTVLTTIKSEAGGAPLLQGIFMSRPVVKEAKLYGKTMTFKLGSSGEAAQVDAFLRKGRYIENGWISQLDKSCSNVFGGFDYRHTSIALPGSRCWPTKLNATLKEGLKFVSPRNFKRSEYRQCAPRICKKPKHRKLRSYVRRLSGYWSPKLPNTKDCEQKLKDHAQCRSPWKSVVLCNDRWDPDYPVGCAPTFSAHAQKYKYDRHISDKTVCSGMDMQEACNEFEKAKPGLCAKELSRQFGNSQHSQMLDGPLCGDVHDLFVKMPLEANRHVKSVKLIGFPLADDPFKFRASGSTTLTYWWKPPDDLPDAPCTIEPGVLRFQNEDPIASQN